MRVLLLVFVVVVAASGPAGAQSWLKKLKDNVGSTIGSVTGNQSGGGTASALSTGDIVAGLREALKVGSGRVVTQLAAADGYNADPAIHIPLPPELTKVQSMLKQFGLSGLADDVELKLNRAAEAAAPGTRGIFWKAIEGMTLDDARGIYEGADDAATRYFERAASGDLMALIKPIVDRTLAEVGAIAAYDRLLEDYTKLPLVPDVKTQLSDYATQKALAGLFHYLAREEAGIRRDPAKRTTEVLIRVFGG